MRIFRRVLLYFPTLLGISIIFSIPVGFIFTSSQYGSGTLEMMKSTVDYFVNGTKLSYMFFMWPLGLLLGIPLYLTVALPIVIIVIKLKFGIVESSQIVASTIGILAMTIVFLLQKKGRLNWYTTQNTPAKNTSSDNTHAAQNNHHIPNFVISFSIIAWNVCLTFFMAQYTGHYILANLSNYFRETGGGWISFPQSFIEFISGIPVTYAFFTSLFFGLFRKEGKWNDHLLALSPALLLSALGGVVWFFWTAVFFMGGIFLAKLINLIISKFKQSGL